MRNHALEAELAAHARHSSGPLSYWRTLPAPVFQQQAKAVETATLSIVAVSRLAPGHLISDLTHSVEEERIPVWNELARRFTVLDGMHNGLAADISGSFAALSASEADPLGLVLLLGRLSEPYIRPDTSIRIGIAATWLATRGALLNTTSLSEVDWHQFDRDPASDEDNGSWGDGE